MARTGALTALLISAALLVPTDAGAATTFGANLNRTPNNANTCQSFGYGPITCSVESTNLVTGESGFPPVGLGRITRVRVRVGPVTGPMQIVVEEALRKDNPGDPGHPTYACCKAINLSQVFTPAPNAVTTVAVNLPVRQDIAPDPASGYYVDDHLALSVLSSNVPIPASAEPNASVGGWLPAWTQGQERCCPYGTSGFQILFNADWDPATSAPGTGGGVGTPAGALRLGRLRLARDGSGRLTLAVPGPGTLRLGDGAGAARAAAKKKKRKALVRSVSKKVRKAGKVTLRITPTKTARRRLARKHKVAVKLRITFRPAGAKSVATVTKKVILRRK
jgi:hypothetical protein